MYSLSLFCCLVFTAIPVLTLSRAQGDVAVISVDPNQANGICDDGKFGIQIDIGLDSNWECQSETSLKTSYKKPSPVTVCNRTSYNPIFKCIDEPLTYNDRPPLVGDYRPVAPQYGEYTYLPPQRWLHALRLGAVAFLYHPCTPPEQVTALRELARSCLWKYVLTPYPHLTQDEPLALVSWGCMYRMEWVEPDTVKEWLHQNALKTDESSDISNGTYTEGLVQESDHELSVNQICSTKVEIISETTPPVQETSDNEPTNQSPPCPHGDTPTIDSDSPCNGPTTLILVDTSHHRLTVLIALLIVILLLAILLVLWRLMASCQGKGRVKGKYKSVSKYFPVSAGSGEGMAIPEMGIPKDGLSEREKLLEDSDEDEL